MRLSYGFLCLSYQKDSELLYYSREFLALLVIHASTIESTREVQEIVVHSHMQLITTAYALRKTRLSNNKWLKSPGLVTDQGNRFQHR